MDEHFVTEPVPPVYNPRLVDRRAPAFRFDTVETSVTAVTRPVIDNLVDPYTSMVS